MPACKVDGGPQHTKCFVKCEYATCCKVWTSYFVLFFKSKNIALKNLEVSQKKGMSKSKQGVLDGRGEDYMLPEMHLFSIESGLDQPEPHRIQTA